MNKSTLVFVAILVFTFSSKAQTFDPAASSKSVVKVYVTTDGENYGICTGFLWRNPSQIVTSLHAMKEGGKIRIEYKPGINRYAEISKIFADGDLVLLTLKAGQSPPEGAVAITQFQEKVVTREEIVAIGFNGGSASKQTQELRKGFADPENIISLVRHDDQQSVKTIGIPADEFAIYFLTGSLLPGFSGSPVFNLKGELIGIGDGGLEKGMMNVSWCIPAKNLLTLEASNNKILPKSLKKADLLYSAEVKITLKPETANATEEEAFVALQKEASEKYKSFAGNGFEFYLTKTRTWTEMLETTSDPYNMNMLTNEFYSNGLYVDSAVLAYDIYEDVVHGISIAIPENTELYFDPNWQSFNVKMDSLAEGENFTLFYNSWENYGDTRPMDGIIASIKAGWGENYSTLEEDPNYSYTHQVNESWYQETKLLQTQPFVVGTLEDGSPYYLVSFLYINVVFDGTNSFYSVANCYFPLNRPELTSAFESGMDCINFYDEHWETCDYFESMLQVMGASHLTTLSY